MVSSPDFFRNTGTMNISFAIRGSNTDGGMVVECNTAYDGERNTTEKHLVTIEKHGWNKYFDVDLLDAEGPDLELDIPKGKQILHMSLRFQSITH